MKDKTYTIEEVWEAKQKSFKEGYDHREPSAPTIQALKEISNNLKEFREEFIEVKTDMKYIKKEVEGIDEKFVTKEIFNAKLSSLNKQIAIYVGVGVFLVNIAVSFIMDKIK